MILASFMVLGGYNISLLADICCINAQILFVHTLSYTEQRK